jgi:DNA-binding NtrC family response regulator
MDTRRVLLVGVVNDVESEVRKCSPDNYEVVAVPSGSEAVSLLSRESFDVVVGDIGTREARAEALTNWLGYAESKPLIIATRSTSESLIAVDDCIDWPPNAAKIIHSIARTIDYAELRRENHALTQRVREAEALQSIVGISDVIDDVRERIRRVSASDVAVLICGEPGTGKELAAREIHRLSRRAAKPLVKVHCAGVSEQVLEGELIGHSGVPGRLELAHGGTLLLDNIGALPGTVQARLVQVIKDGSFRHGGRTVPVHTRIVATTDQDLTHAVSEGSFREDLLYRINVVPIDMPPLRARRNDIPLLVAHVIDRFARATGNTQARVSNAALSKLSAGYWRGNVRELENVVERALVLASGDVLGPEQFSFDDHRDQLLSEVEDAFRFGSIRHMERLMILNRLGDNEGNRTHAAATLDISVRTLRNKLRDYRAMGVAVRPAGNRGLLAIDKMSG